MLFPLLLVAAGFYIYTQDKNSRANQIGGPVADPHNPASPSQRYPFKMVPVARGDVNPPQQPWYGGSKAFQFANPAKLPSQSSGGMGDLSQGVGLANNVVSLWNNLDPGSFFSSDDSEETEDFSEDEGD